MAYDAAEAAVVLFGGFNGSPYLNDTWTWQNGAWTQVSPPSSPSPRSDASMAYDRTTHRAVLFGGVNNSTFLGDTWTWAATRSSWGPLDEGSFASFERP